MLKIRRAVRDDATRIMLVRRQAILAKAAAHYDQVILNDWAGAPDVTDRVAHIRKKNLRSKLYRCGCRSRRRNHRLCDGGPFQK